MVKIINSAESEFRFSRMRNMTSIKIQSRDMYPSSHRELDCIKYLIWCIANKYFKTYQKIQEYQNKMFVFAQRHETGSHN